MRSFAWLNLAAVIKSQAIDFKGIKFCFLFQQFIEIRASARSMR
jgi:hypothetical protein